MPQPGSSCSLSLYTGVGKDDIKGDVALRKTCGPFVNSARYSSLFISYTDYKNIALYVFKSFKNN